MASCARAPPRRASAPSVFRPLHSLTRAAIVPYLSQDYGGHDSLFHSNAIYTTNGWNCERRARAGRVPLLPPTAPVRSPAAPPRPASPLPPPVINVAGFMEGHEDLVYDNDYVHTV